MKLGYFADGPWSHLALERILSNQNVELMFIVPRFDTQDPVLKEKALELGIPYFPHENVNSDEFLAWVSGFKADLFISMSFNQILKSRLINLPPKGFINCHAGALPFYRGRNPLNWVLINGEKHFGVTVHYIDEGIDTGDILLQHLEPISEDDNYRTLLDKAFLLCADLLAKSVSLISKGEETRTKQDSIHAVGFYCGMRRVGDERIDWLWSSERLVNFIRGITLPAPGARTYVSQSEIGILAAEIIEDAPNYICTPGEVVGRNEKGNLVKSGTSTLLITEVCDIDKQGNLHNNRRPEYRIGTRFN